MTGLAVPLKLTIARLRASPLRLLLTATAMAAAAGAVVWVVSGYDALIAQFDDMADDYLGRFHLVVAPESTRVRALPWALADELRADAGVAEVVASYQANVAVRVVRTAGPDGADATERPNSPATVGPVTAGRGRGRSPSPALLGMASPVAPYPMVEGKWLDPEGDSQLVISKSTARELGVSLGDQVEVTHALDGRGQPVAGAAPRVLSVVGVIEQPQTQAALAPRGDAPRGAARGPAASALYVLHDTAELVTGERTVPHMLFVRLADTAPLSEFRGRWECRLADSSPAALVITQQEIESGLENSFSTQLLRGQAYSATGMALLASLLIIYTTLNMGVAERARQCTVLRAVALSRGQLAAIVLLESALLALLGWGGGLFAGWLLLRYADAGPSGVAPMLGWQCVLLSGACALGGARLAAAWPMWRAAHGAPLGAIQQPGPAPAYANPLALAGLGLMVLPLVLAFAVPIDDGQTYAVTTATGVLLLALGVLMIAPKTVLLAERWLAPGLARVMRLDPRLLMGQLSSNLWRTIGAASALTLGLSLYVATQTWGHSMLQPFVPGGWMPDVLVHFPRGVSDADLPEVARLAAASPGGCLPIALEQPKLTDDITNSEARWNAACAESVVVCGVDIKQALTGPKPLLDLHFTAGTLAEALPQLEAGRACLIPDFLQAESGVQLGDTLRLSPPKRPGEVVEYTVVGAVAQPGVHWLTKMSGMRRRGWLMAGVVLANYADVREDFAITTNDFFWMDLPAGRTASDVQESLEPIAERNDNPPQPAGGGMGRAIGPGRRGPSFVRASPRRLMSARSSIDARTRLSGP